MSYFKKALTRLLAVMLSFNSAGIRVLAEENSQKSLTPKVTVSISSKLDEENTTTVEGNIYDDYSAKLVLPNADVSPSNATVSIRMTNVGSLGISGTREASYPFSTDLSGRANLYATLRGFFGDDEHLFSFGSSTISGTVVSGNATRNVTYQVSGSEFNENSPEKVITATTDEASARAAWLLVADHIAASTKSVDDSYIIVKAGTTVQINKDLLVFDTDCKIDNLSDMSGNESAIRNAASLHTVDNKAYSALIKEGTTLALGTSQAVLEDDAILSVDLSADFSILPQLQAVSSTGDAIKVLLAIMNGAVGLVDGNTVYGKIIFSEEWEVKEWKWDTTGDEPKVTCVFNLKGDDSVVLPVEATVTANETGYTASAPYPAGDQTATDTKSNFELDETLKFRLGILSSDGKVIGSVYNDYNADMIYSGDQILFDSLALDVWMKNVASLGVSGTRHFTTNIPLGSGSIPTSYFGAAFNYLDGKVIIGTVKNTNNSVKYNITKDANDAKKFNATTDKDAAAKVWADLFNSNTITPSTGADDSYLVIGHGSTLTFGNEKLVFEDSYIDNLKLDNFNNLDKNAAEIRKALKVVAGDNKVEALLMPGTEISLGQSKVVLNKEVKIEVNLDASQYVNVLSTARAADNSELMQQALGLLITTIKDFPDTTKVDFTYGHIMTKTDEVPATCTTAGTAAYWTCSVCGKMFSDEEGTNEITEPVEIDALEHKWDEPNWTWSGYEEVTA
ncbi:MAG: hypothetical protein IIY33_06580, partial [Erysipelotrichaceae bacterium]|nr:hypothetical protein [Erysipelotrichaceae bacterium]